MTLSRSITAVAAWVAGASMSVAVGLLALSMISDRIVANPVHPPVADDVVAPQAAGVTHSPQPKPPRPSATAPRPATSTGPTPRAAEKRTSQPGRVVTSPGGTVVVHCRNGGAYLVSWSPYPGYHAQDVVRGPGPVAAVTFDSGRRTARLAVRCVEGEPQTVPDLPEGPRHQFPPDEKQAPRPGEPRRPPGDFDPRP